jgi:hypothetical protein
MIKSALHLEMEKPHFPSYSVAFTYLQQTKRQLIEERAKTLLWHRAAEICFDRNWQVYIPFLWAG